MEMLRSIVKLVNNSIIYIYADLKARLCLLLLRIMGLWNPEALKAYHMCKYKYDRNQV
jgi:hypothetical protein